MKRVKLFVQLLLCLVSTSTWCWNATGHRLVAEVAFLHLTPGAKEKLYKNLGNQRITDAAVWLDTLRYRDITWYDHLHYADIPFTRDGTPLPPQNPVNAVWALEHAVKVLQSPKSNRADKRFALNVLLHVTGDIHQPMHAVTQISARNPRGDRGGNLFPLRPNPIARNLHAWWDNGGGLLNIRGRNAGMRRESLLHAINTQYVCHPENEVFKPRAWRDESHALATRVAYRLHEGVLPDAAYKRQTQQITRSQIARAGCRLAAVLNRF